MMADQRAHVWDTQKYDGSVIEMEGSTMGIVALGGIGLAVARRAAGFGMKGVRGRQEPVQRSTGRGSGLGPG